MARFTSPAIQFLLSITVTGFSKEVESVGKTRPNGSGSQQVQVPTVPAKAPATTVKARVVKISMVDGMRFEPPRISAKPGESLLFKIENLDSSHQPHNFLVIAPGQIQAVVRDGLELGEKGAVSGFIPKHPAVLASTGKVLDPESGFELPFMVPKDSGIYGYVCTVPGHGMVMYGALYVGEPMPPLSKDSNIPQLTLEKGLAGGGRRPFVQRMFLPNAGPAAIGVALPGAQNICFDAGVCRLRYAWRGPFFDATPYWRGNGNDLAELGEDPWWVPSEFPLKIEGSDLSKVKFLGYRLTEGVPEFHYRAGQHEVYESVVASGDGLEIRLQIPTANGSVSYNLGDGPYTWRSPQGKSVGSQIIVAASDAKRFTIFLEPKAAAGKREKK